MPIQIILSFFDEKIGPRVIYTHPEEIEKEASIFLKGIFDIELKTHFFELKQEDYHYLIYRDYIHFPNIRAKYENLALTIILTGDQVLFNWKPELEKIIHEIQEMRNVQDIFKIHHSPTPIVQMKLSKISRLFRQLEEKIQETEAAQPYGKLLVVGVEKVGKTSILNRIKNGTFIPTVRPTLGTQIIRAAIEKFHFQIFDVGGQKSIRKTWFRGITNPDAIIYVVDVSSPESRDREYFDEFNRVIDHYIHNPRITGYMHIPVLVLINKIDLITNDLWDSQKNRFTNLLDIDTRKNPIHFGLTSAKENIGILKAFRWLISQKILH